MNKCEDCFYYYVVKELDNGHIIKACECPVPAYVGTDNTITGTEANSCKYYIEVVSD